MIALIKTTSSHYISFEAYIYNYMHARTYYIQPITLKLLFKYEIFHMHVNGIYFNFNFSQTIIYIFIFTVDVSCIK